MDKAAQLREFLAQNGFSPAEIAKATGDYSGLSGIRIIEDLWDDIHRVPTAKETTTGPSMSSSSPGADAAMRNYSNPAPQVGITKEYEAMAGHTAAWEDLRNVAKSIGQEIIGEIRSMRKADELEHEEHGKATAKDADPDADADPSKSATAKDADPDADPSRKSRSVTTLYTRLAKAEEEAAETEHKKEHDKEEMHEAKSYISRAETYIEQVEAAKSESVRELYTLRAEAAIGKAFEHLMKSRPVERHGLKGDGNQSDTAIPGSIREAEAKAKYWQLKVAHMKGEVAKDADPDPDPDPSKSATAKDADPDADADPGKSGDKDKGKAMYCARFHGPEAHNIKAAADHFMKASTGELEPANTGAHKAVKDALRRYSGYLDKAESEHEEHEHEEHEHKAAEPEEKATAKDADPDADPGKSAVAKDADPDADPSHKADVDLNYRKAVNERLQLIERNMAANQNRPTITPLILQKSGITNEPLAERMHGDVAKWYDEGRLTDDDATMADALIERYRAVGKGHAGITANIVSQQLEQAPIPVRNFFEQYNSLPN